MIWLNKSIENRFMQTTALSQEVYFTFRHLSEELWTHM